MAKIIEFYIPSGFRKNGKRIPVIGRGKLIEFPSQPRLLRASS